MRFWIWIWIQPVSTGFRSNQSGKPLPEVGGLTGAVSFVNPGHDPQATTIGDAGQVDLLACPWILSKCVPHVVTLCCLTLATCLDVDIYNLLTVLCFPASNNKHNKPTMPPISNVFHKLPSPFHQLITAGQTCINRCRMQRSNHSWRTLYLNEDRDINATFHTQHREMSKELQ